MSLGKSITLAQARDIGMQACIERMLNFTEQLRRLRVDRYEYVAMKVIVLLTSGNYFNLKFVINIPVVEFISIRAKLYG